MFCEKCGANLPAGTKFCGGCGAKTETPPASPRPPVPPQTPPVASPATAGQTPPAYAPQPGSQPLSVGQYIVMFLLLCVPILNIILLFMWSFGETVNPGKRNFARASLILFAVLFIFILVGGGAIMGALEGLMR